PSRRVIHRPSGSAPCPTPAVLRPAAGPAPRPRCTSRHPASCEGARGRACARWRSSPRAAPGAHHAPRPRPPGRRLLGARPPVALTLPPATGALLLLPRRRRWCRGPSAAPLGGRHRLALLLALRQPTQQSAKPAAGRSAVRGGTRLGFRSRPLRGRRIPVG